ncbi:MBL fold metallo-hydrolase [Vibrio fluvialis]|uniref:MBL fold metallo-hydrolase n=1 Tax=Vibrio fluvialis TaxID=676 RepID=UPI00130298E4|nr:MBL fold metallo-hydrolase [Vibrio fluvialis]
MKITQIRNATQVIDYAGKTFLIDPMLAPKGTYPGFQGTANPHLRNPTVELPLPLESIINVDAVLLTHTHPDHWDETAVNAIPKDKLIFVQHEGDEAILLSQGFTNVKIFSEETEYHGISFTRTVCQHGSDAAFQHDQMAEILGEVTGVIFSHADEEKLYVVGDTIWIPSVEETMKKEQPGVVILNTGWAHVLGFGPIIMGKEDVLKTHQVLPQAKIVATHMGAVNHVLVTTQEMREYAAANMISDFVFVPEDGETVAL